MPHPASQRLTRNIDKIMMRWEARTYMEVAAATHQGSLALRNSLPEYLAQLAGALSATIERSDVRIKWDREASLQLGKKHGRDRAQSFDYTMDQMIFEYHILRQVICEVLEEEAPLSLVEREIIVCSIEQAVNDGAAQFSNTLGEIQEQLSQMLAHDLRSPLMAAKTGAALILRRPEDADHCVSMAKRISATIDQLDAMIKDLLDASLLKAGQQLSMEFAECQLDEFVRQLADEFSLVYGNRFAIDAPAAVRGYWDVRHLRRVLENLTTNAVKYGDSSTQITLGANRVNGRVILSVHNHGKAISPQEQEILFLHARRPRPAGSPPGWGLGLMVVKGIVEAHGGTITVTSAEDEGTRFVAELPMDSRLARTRASNSIANGSTPRPVNNQAVRSQ